jgi:Uma2 family endonuclease
MRSMSLTTSYTEVLGAIDQLPPGASLVVHDFEWDEYERLLEALVDGRHVHVTYDCGRLDILSASSPHEAYGWFINLLVCAFCEAKNLKVRGLGGTTWHKKLLKKGLEADECYYIQSVDLIRGRTNITLELDPPPDLAVEVDITNSSERKMSVYSALSIPEVWRYDGETLRLYALSDGKYVDIQESHALPGLTVSMLIHAIEASKADEPMDAIKEFRKRIQSS